MGKRLWGGGGQRKGTKVDRGAEYTRSIPTHLKGGQHGSGRAPNNLRRPALLKRLRLPLGFPRVKLLYQALGVREHGGHDGQHGTFSVRAAVLSRTHADLLHGAPARRRRHSGKGGVAEPLHLRKRAAKGPPCALVGGLRALALHRLRAALGNHLVARELGRARCTAQHGHAPKHAAALAGGGEEALLAGGVRADTGHAPAAAQNRQGNGYRQPRRPRPMLTRLHRRMLHFHHEVARGACGRADTRGDGSVGCTGGAQGSS